MHTKATPHFLGVKVILALFIVLMEIIFINSLASAGMEFVFSSAAVTRCVVDTAAVWRAAYGRFTRRHGGVHVQLAVS